MELCVSLWHFEYLCVTLPAHSSQRIDRDFELLSIFIYRTNIKTVFHTRLVIDFEDLREIKRIAYGKKIFETFKKDTDLPEQLYETSVVAAINILKNL